MDYKSESIIPNQSEIFDENFYIDYKKFLRKHTMPYKSSEEYLERLFYLMREDCFYYLKNALRVLRFQFNHKNENPELSNVWIYYDVSIFNYSFHSSEIVNIVKFKCLDEVKWSDNKRLIFGSLLFLSCDNFRSYYTATVAESNLEDLESGYLKISFVDVPENLSNLMRKRFKMIETQAYFESYVHILKQLQKIDNLPFSDYFIKNKINSITLRHMTNNNRIFLNDVKNLHLSQRIALETAVSRDLSIIQGPPGTGKSTVGVLILKFILNNYLSFNYVNKPILIICYTNHALDQFLESIIDKCKPESLIRIGSQSESDAIKPYNINIAVEEWKSKRRFPKFLNYQRSMARKKLNDLKDILNKKLKDFNWISKEECREYLDLLNEYKDLGMKEQEVVMREATVIGITTTACARYADIFKEIGISVIIVEEAAEILEAHLICSLSSSCQQLIMIGDHKQLQPSCNVHEFKTMFDLDCSLFERLIDIGFNNVDLKEQRRMRPEISCCLSPIYPGLIDHESVKKYPNVNGFRTNIYFFDHTKLEEVKNKTYLNKFEVTFVEKIYNFLIESGVDSKKITILSTYRGQNSEIKKKLKHSQTYVVDSYQGKENDIIILSLVRSNVNETIGFLKKENRICVALSRARHGLFIVGNMSCLKRHLLWLNLSKILDKNIGTSIPVKCKRNSNHDIFITKDLEKSDFCHYKCDKLNLCGIHFCSSNCHDGQHPLCVNKVIKICPRKRHKVNIECHKTVICESETFTKLPCGHQAKFICSGNVPEKCIEMVIKQIKCSHSQELLCGTDESKVVCNKRYEQTLECGHIYIDCIAYVGLCNRKINYLLNCGHKVIIRCFERKTKVKCDKNCDKKMLCGHTYEHFCIDCDGGNFHKKCSEIIEYLLPCKHLKMIKCSDRDLYHKCLEPCSKTLKCGHLCNFSCIDCNGGNLHKPCKTFIDYQLPCKHMKTIRCSEKCLDHTCYSMCKKIMSCGHTCQNLCNDCSNGQLHKPCQEMISHKLECGHLKEIKCFSRQHKHTCLEICNKKMICGHLCKNICKDCDGGIIHKACNEIILHTLPCQHNKRMKCSEKELVHSCYEICSKKMICGHLCKNVCKSCDGGNIHVPCSEIISYLLPCQHNIKIKCSEKSIPHSCFEICNKIMTCGHICNYICKDCDGGKIHKQCIEIVNQVLLCQHNKLVKCSEKNLKQTCFEPCKKVMPCGHTYEHLCKDCDGGIIHKACNERILHPLPCQHNKQVKCSEKNLVHSCFEICSKKMICGHRCLNVCHKCDGGKFHEKCTEIITQQLVCEHEKLIKCFQRQDSLIKCESICSKRLVCGHLCNHFCKDCDSGTKHKACCSDIQYKLPCKHLTSIKCSDKYLKQVLVCDNVCQKKLPCGHSCLNLCTDCIGGRLHRHCKTRCDLKLICGHSCSDLCHLGQCQMCVENCFISSIKNINLFPKKYDEDFVKKWILLKDSFNIELPYSGKKTFIKIVNYLLTAKFNKHESKAFIISFKLYEKTLDFFNEVFLKIDFNGMLTYKENILSSVCAIIEWLSPLNPNVIKSDLKEFELEFQRIKDLALVCQLNEKKENKVINFDLMDQLLDVQYDTETKLKFKNEINVRYL